MVSTTSANRPQPRPNLCGAAPFFLRPDCDGCEDRNVNQRHNMALIGRYVHASFVPVLLVLFTVTTNFGDANAATGSKELISGQVLSGDTPIMGAVVTLYGSIYGCSPDPCFTSSQPVEQTTADARGNFSIDLSKARVTTTVMGYPPGPRLQTVQVGPQSGTLYLIASGGNAGYGINPAIKLVLLLGGATPERRVVINELTTAIALLSIGRTVLFPAPLTSDTFALNHDLIDPASGRLRPLLSRGANSPALVNSLADILHSCVASAGNNSRECASLFRETSPISWDKKVTDTSLAMQSIVLHPERTSRSLFDLIPKAPPYKPVLTAPPAGWLLTINFTGGGMSRPTAIVADEPDKALWIVNTGNHSLTELSGDPVNLGLPMHGPRGLRIKGLRQPSALWFQPGSRIPPPSVGPNTQWWVQPDKLWVTDKAGNDLTIITPKKGGDFSVKRIVGNGLAAPVGVIAHSSIFSIYQGGPTTPFGLIIVTNSGADRISFFHFDGTACGSPLEDLGLKNPLGLAGYGSAILIANSGVDEVLAVKPPDMKCGGARLVQRIRGGGLNTPQYIEDGWITNRANSSVSRLGGFASLDAYRVAETPSRAGGLAEPEGIAIGGGSVWVVNHALGANSITWFGGRSAQSIYGKTEPWTPLSSAQGFSGAGMNRPYGIAIDAMGNIWVTNEGNDSVTMFVGAAQRTM
jgi:hypothetical protein